MCCILVTHSANLPLASIKTTGPRYGDPTGLFRHKALGCGFLEVPGVFALVAVQIISDFISNGLLHYHLHQLKTVLHRSNLSIELYLLENQSVSLRNIYPIKDGVQGSGWGGTSPLASATIDLPTTDIS